IPAGTTIVSVDSANNKLSISAAATKTTAGVAILIENGAQSHSESNTFNELDPNTTTTSSHTDGKTSSNTTTSNQLLKDVQTCKNRSTTTPAPTYQRSETKGFSFQHPSSDNDTQNHRIQVSLLDERFRQFMFSQNLPYLEFSLQNELDSIDLEVKRLQV